MDMRDPFSVCNGCIAYKLTITTKGQTGVSAGKWLKNTEEPAQLA